MLARRTGLMAAALLGVLALGACTAPQTPAGPVSSAPPSTTASSAPASTAPGSGAPAEPAEPADEATLALAMTDSSLGEILVDGKGMTLYMFTKDSANTSACIGPCLVAWPPLLGVPTAGAGVDDSKLGSFSRQDGATQATYNGWPLYYWKDDKAAGDVLGQNVNSVWFVLDRDGDPVKG